MSRHLLFAILFTLSSCAQFDLGRDLLSDNDYEHGDDSGFYKPERDFPVMAGDSGLEGETLSDFQSRAPASEEDVLAARSNQSLKDELRQLENRQSEKNLALYQQYKAKLATTSERIYFLKLPANERMDYLSSRGFLANTDAGFDNSRLPANLFRTRNASLNLGMSKVDVVHSWGKPARVEVAGNPSYENERWAYQVNGATKYIYFESGTVQGWE